MSDDRDISCSKALLGCPWCGKKPDIHKHFRDPMWQLLHRCKVMGPLRIDWKDSVEKLVTQWNDRQPNDKHDGRL